jgi:hypothetical protein
METEQSMCPLRSQIQDYAVRFLKYNNQVSDSVVLSEAPPTPDRLNDFGILKVSDQLSQVICQLAVVFVIYYVHYFCFARHFMVIVVKITVGSITYLRNYKHVCIYLSIIVL